MTNRRWLTIIFTTLASVAVLSVSVMALTIPTVRSAAFLDMFPDPFLMTIDAPFRKYDPPCQVVIYGDSSSVTGQDPRTIESATGLKACNISLPVTVVGIMGTQPLDWFLERNPKPKYIVLNLGPETFWGANMGWDNGSGFYPLSLLLRNRLNASTLWTMTLHPVTTLVYFQSVLQAKYFPPTEHLKEYRVTYAAALNQYRKVGYLTLVVPPETHCAYTHGPINAPIEEGWIRSLRTKYESQGIRFIVKASDVPACDTSLTFLQNALHSFVDGNVKALPVEDFNDYDRHFDLQGAHEESLETAALINERQTKDASNPGNLKR